MARSSSPASRPAALFTGAEEIKTPEQAAIFGGTAGEAFDPCYHQGCDDIFNLSTRALDQMSDAAAHATVTLAQAKTLPARGITPAQTLRSAGHAHGDWTPVPIAGN